MNNLPKVVTQRCLEQDLNPRPTDRKPKCLTRCTTVPPLKCLTGCISVLSNCKCQELEASLASSRASVASLEDDVKQRAQDADDVRSQLQQLTLERDVSDHCMLYCFLAFYVTIQAVERGYGDGARNTAEENSSIFS